MGSHTCIELLEAGYEVTIVNDLSNGYLENLLDRVKDITEKSVTFHKLDIKNTKRLREVLSQNIDAVIHFAGLKSSTKSISKPMRYFDVNVLGTISLLEMGAAKVRQLIFSSTAAVYGIPESVPVSENAPVGNTLNPYTESKLIIENLLKSYGKTSAEFQFAILRYFNPVGVHPSGLLGETPKGVSNNLMPHVGRVATGQEPSLKVFGDDYPTPDGMGVRDYIHVMDLAKGHVSALNYLNSGHGYGLFNLGAGIGYSVLDLVKNFETVTGLSIPLDFAPRRKGEAMLRVVS